MDFEAIYKESELNRLLEAAEQEIDISDMEGLPLEKKKDMLRDALEMIDDNVTTISEKLEELKAAIAAEVSPTKKVVLVRVKNIQGMISELKDLYNKPSIKELYEANPEVDIANDEDLLNAAQIDNGTAALPGQEGSTNPDELDIQEDEGYAETKIDQAEIDVDMALENQIESVDDIPTEDELDAQAQQETNADLQKMATLPEYQQVQMAQDAIEKAMSVEKGEDIKIENPQLAASENPTQTPPAEQTNPQPSNQKQGGAA